MKVIIIFYWFMLTPNIGDSLTVHYDTKDHKGELYTMESCIKHQRKFVDRYKNNYFAGCLEITPDMMKEKINGKEV